MSDIQPLEEAKKRLTFSQSSLLRAIETASTRISHVNSEIRSSQKELDAAERRYDRLKRLTEVLCDDCWEVFPTLGEGVHAAADALGARDGGGARNASSRADKNSCVNCAGSIKASHDSASSDKNFGFPSSSTEILFQAEVACEEGKYARDGRDGLDFIPKIVKSWKSNSPSRYAGWSHAHASRTPRKQCTHSKPMESKRVFLSIASQQKDTSKERFETASKSLREWKLYKSQHEEQLRKVTEEIKRVIECEKKLLQSKLDKLNKADNLDKRGGVKNRASGTSDHLEHPGHQCVVCMDRDKDMAFQCGHQCCSGCARHLHRCHACRAVIILRIKLYS